MPVDIFLGGHLGVQKKEMVGLDLEAWDTGNAAPVLQKIPRPLPGGNKPPLHPTDPHGPTPTVSLTLQDARPCDVRRPCRNSSRFAKIFV